ARTQNHNIGPDKTGSVRGALTYRELEKKSRHLARVLRENGVKPDTIVALMSERSPGLIIGILGILEAGGAYLPINPALPTARIRYMLADANVEILLTTRALSRTIAFNGRLIYIEEEIPGTGTGEEQTGTGTGEEQTGTGTGEEQTRPHPAPPVDQPASTLAYVIYTSGSTGKPKGVLVTHNSLVNFVFGMSRRFEDNFSHTDKCLSLTAISFDVSVAEIFIPLSFGSTMVLMPDANIFDVDNLAGMLLDESITFTYIPPSLLTAVFEKLSLHAAKVKLNKVLVGVEPIADSVLENYQRLKPSIRIVNAYGPTEATICATACVYRSHEPTGAIVSIGSPLDNAQVFILNREHRLTPTGTSGELCIAGDGLARGYLNNPELTAEKFIKRYEVNNYFTNNQYPVTNTQSLYRTGDLARWLEDGNIEFLGRIDTQVKIRGFRIELGEIETRLREHETIKNAVVIDLEDGAGEKYLCAYTVNNSQQEITAAELAALLSEYLAKELPPYMVPMYYVALEKMPLTVSGKINRKLLPLPETTSTKKYVPPGNPAEEKLVELWADVLGIKKETIGIDDNFFHLGGQSLKITSLAAKIFRSFNVKLPPTDIFKNPTVRGLAALLQVVAWTFEPKQSNETQQEKEEFEL
ncbi:MAG: amino acid adenylation domain-containing protein, partial [bacterium]|nr:amino acid adenylation domain-containing protein [bacterium]